MYEYNPNGTNIELMVYHLRDEHRLKILCDYAYTHNCVTKEFTFCSKEIWVDMIEEHCKEYNISFKIIKLYT